MFPIKDTKTFGSFPAVNLTLIAANIYMFFLELTAPDLDLFISTYALIPANVNFQQLETLTPFITSLFIHAGFLHILSNMWFLWVFGDNVEAAMGHVKYLAFYIMAGIAASLTQFIFISDASLPMVGASGAIAGVLGAYLKYFPHHKIDSLVLVLGLPIIVAVPASFMLVYWFITQAFNGVASILATTAAVGQIAYLAHAGGFIWGLVTSTAFAKRQRSW